MNGTNGEPSGPERLEDNKYKLTINISAEDLERGINHAYNEEKGKIRLPGFRAGKVPRKMVELHYGKNFFYEPALDHILPEIYQDAVIASGLKAVSKPTIEIVEIESGKGAVVTAEFWVKPVIETPVYKGIEYTKADVSVSDDEVASFIDRERDKNARIIPVTDRTAMEGDITVIDFEGFMDEIPFDGGKGEDYELTLGSGRFIDGFEEQVVGMAVGEEKDVLVTFPEEYHAEHLKGKPARFHVTLKELRFKEMPELDDDFAQNVSDFETLAAYKDDVREKLLADKEHEALHMKEDSLITSLADRVTETIPEAMIETEIDHMVNSFSRQLRMQGMKLEHFFEHMNTDMESLRASYAENAKRSVKSRLALEAVAVAEGFAATDEELDKEIQTMAESYGIDPARIKESMSQNETDALNMDICVRKALDLIMAEAKELPAIS